VRQPQGTRQLVVHVQGAFDEICEAAETSACGIVATALVEGARLVTKAGY
jgi:hypothetical protein